MKKTIFALILALLPLSANADLTFIDDTSKFQFAPITLNPAEPDVGENVRVTVTVYNTSDEEQQGLIDVYAGKGGEQIGNNLAVVVPPRGVDSVTMTWHPVVQGYYNLNANLEATVGSVSVSKFNLMVYVEGNGSTITPATTTDASATDTSANTITTETANSSDSSQNSESSSTISPTTGTSVEFTAADENLADGDIVVWNFSDGDSYTGTTIKRTFENSGDYEVTRLIIAADGSTQSEVTKFRIADNDSLILFGSYFYFWLFLLLLLILAGIIIYTHKQSQKTKKSRRR